MSPVLTAENGKIRSQFYIGLQCSAFAFQLVTCFGP